MALREDHTTIDELNRAQVSNKFVYVSDHFKYPLFIKIPKL